MKNLTKVNHATKTITTFEMTNELAEMIANILPKTEIEPVYSLGFQRLMLLSKSKRRNAERALILNGVSINEVHSTIKHKLEQMTEAEFKAFKKQA